jgi:choline dehydrogenase
MWHRMTTSQSACANLSLYAGTGRGMGGSGAVNGMVYTRGDRRDFARWPTSWQWGDVIPAFEAVEKKLGIRPRPLTSFGQAFIDAAISAGFRRKDGMNDGDLGGFVGCNDMNYEGANRRSSYRAWLHDHKLPNLTVITGAQVQQLIFDQAQKAIAVEFQSNGESRRISINREVVLCAGALETPRLLMLSGVGPRAQLEQLQIPVVLDADGVGKNLQDHPNVCLFYRVKQPVDFSYPQIYGFDVARRHGNDPPSDAPDSCYVCYAAPASLKHSMLRMVPILALPGALYRLGFLRSLLRGMIHFAFALPPLRRFVAQVFGIVVILGKPAARGEIRLTSRDPRAPVAIDPAYYATSADRDTMLAAVDKARGIAAQPALAKAGISALSAGARTDQQGRVWKWITSATMTTFHFCGSCRMGDDDASPVDTRLRVKGLRNVRVADASVIPEIPVSALNAPSMMIGYRAADYILAGE